jgi:hypothetical protein
VLRCGVLGWAAYTHVFLDRSDRHLLYISMPNFIFRYREYLDRVSDFQLGDNYTNTSADLLHAEALVAYGPNGASQ